MKEKKARKTIFKPEQPLVVSATFTRHIATGELMSVKGEPILWAKEADPTYKRVEVKAKNVKQPKGKKGKGKPSEPEKQYREIKLRSIFRLFETNPDFGDQFTAHADTDDIEDMDLPGDEDDDDDDDDGDDRWHPYMQPDFSSE